MNWSGAIKPPWMARNASRLINSHASYPAYPHSLVSRAAEPYIKPLSPWNLQLLDWSRRSFSGSSTTSLPRRRLRPEDCYPGFRNASKEHRRGREHNFFDSQTWFNDSVNGSSRQSDPPNTLAPSANPKGTLSRNEALLSDLDRELLFLASQDPGNPRMRNLLYHILYERKQPISVIHYDALILANTSAQYGSAENVRNLVKEMKELAIRPDVNTYKAILRALAVHPDINQITDVIDTCKQEWIDIDTQMLHLICAAYVRADMPEIALSYLNRIEYGSEESALGLTRAGLQSGKAELWLYITFIQHLADRGDWECVMRFLYRLCDDTSLGIPLASRHLDVPYAFWEGLLEQAATAREKWVCLWIWENWVLRAWIKPHAETCIKVLEICADHGILRVAATIWPIMRFVSKEKSISPSDMGTSPSRSTNDYLGIVKSLLAKAQENAPSTEAIPSEADISRMTSDWWMFDIRDKIGLVSNARSGTHSLRINPWSMLREPEDSGHAWARRLSERKEMQQRREERELLRQAHNRRARLEAGHAEMRKTLPWRMLADIEKAAGAELEVEPEAADVTEVPSDDSSSDPVAPTTTPKIILVDPDRLTRKKLAKLQLNKNGTIPETSQASSYAENIFSFKSDTVWVIDKRKDEDFPHEYKDEIQSLRYPRIHLHKSDIVSGALRLIESPANTGPNIRFVKGNDNRIDNHQSDAAQSFDNFEDEQTRFIPDKPDDQTTPQLRIHTYKSDSTPNEPITSSLLRPQTSRSSPAKESTTISTKTSKCTSEPPAPKESHVKAKRDEAVHRDGRKDISR